MTQKYVALFVGIIMLGMFQACQKTNQMNNTMTLIEKDCMPDRKNVGTINNETGTITLVADLFVLMSNDGNSRYLACNMPPNLQINGAKCIYSLVVKEIYPDERLIASPSFLTKIELLK